MARTLALVVALAGIDADVALDPHVVPARPSGQRGQVMGAEGHQRIGQVALGRMKGAVPLPFEQHHHVGPRSPVADGVAKPFRHGAKILADHDDSP